MYFHNRISGWNKVRRFTERVGLYLEWWNNNCWGMTCMQRQKELKDGACNKSCIQPASEHLPQILSQPPCLGVIWRTCLTWPWCWVFSLLFCVQTVIVEGFRNERSLLEMSPLAISNKFQHRILLEKHLFRIWVSFNWFGHWILSGLFALQIKYFQIPNT